MNALPDSIPDRGAAASASRSPRIGQLKIFRSMRRGEFDEAELERQLASRGFFYRFFGRWMKAINKEWQLYPVGVLFGLGFDTATEVALLATTALLASRHIPWYAITCLPILLQPGHYRALVTWLARRHLVIDPMCVHA